MKGIEDVPGTGSADDGIVKPHEQKPLSWMDHKIEFVSSAWDPKDRKDDTVYITPRTMNTSPEHSNRSNDECSVGRTLPGLRGFPHSSGQFMVSGHRRRKITP